MPKPCFADEKHLQPNVYILGILAKVSYARCSDVPHCHGGHLLVTTQSKSDGHTLGHPYAIFVNSASKHSIGIMSTTMVWLYELCKHRPN